MPRARRNPFLGSGETRGEGDGGDIQRFGRRSRVEVVERRLSDARPVAVARAIRRLLRLGPEERRADRYGNFVKDTGDEGPVKGPGIGHLLSRDALHVHPIGTAALTDRASCGLQAPDFNNIKPHEGGCGVVCGQLQ